MTRIELRQSGSDSCRVGVDDRLEFDIDGIHIARDNNDQMEFTFEDFEGENRTMEADYIVHDNDAQLTYQNEKVVQTLLLNESDRSTN